MPNVDVAVTAINHARATLERTASVLDELRAGLSAEAGGMEQRQRLVVEEAVRDLESRHQRLIDCLDEMIRAPAEQLPGHWRRFFLGYDEFLHAVRDGNAQWRARSTDAPPS
jgi:hypothetical protein